MNSEINDDLSEIYIECMKNEIFIDKENKQVLVLNARQSREYFDNNNVRIKINNFLSKFKMKLKIYIERQHVKKIVDYMHLIHTLKLENSRKLDAKLFSSLYKLKLINCKIIKNINTLGSLHDLSLIGCAELEDVRAFGNIHTLNLTGCKNIKDVSALKNIYSLNLSECTSVKDVSALKNVHILNLSACDKINDISQLTNVHTLILNYSYNIKDVGNLRKLKIFEISSFVNGIHLLKQLKELIIYEDDCINKINKAVIKLKQINDTVKIRCSSDSDFDFNFNYDSDGDCEYQHMNSY